MRRKKRMKMRRKRRMRMRKPQREQQVETLDWISVVCCPARESDLSDQIQALVFLVHQRPVQCLV